MTTNTTPDLTSTAWLGELLSEISTESAIQSTNWRRKLYEHGPAYLDTRGNLEGATLVVMERVRADVAAVRLDTRTKWRTVPSWSLRTEPFQTGADPEDQGHRHHKVGPDLITSVSGGVYGDPEGGEQVNVEAAAVEMEDGTAEFFVNMSAPDTLSSLTPDEARQLATSLMDAAETASIVAAQA